jgi:Paired amphipathic helix repeat
MQYLILVHFFLDQVGDLLGKYPDLMEGFNEFLTHCENLGMAIFLCGLVTFCLFHC